jgi:tRNA threonylcarbamoyladenosine biosynthesis protein TsaB
LNLLAFDTSTEQLSVAVQRAGAAPCVHSGAGGAQASATLLPAVQQLLADAGLALQALDAIVFGRGPGSFTGLRTACSVAQGLGWGAAVPLLPVDTLLAVAEEARQQSGSDAVVAVLDARMDQVYWASYVYEAGAWRELAPGQLTAPEAVQLPPGAVLAGNAAAAYAGRLPAGPRVDALPTAAALLRLAPRLLAAGLAVPAADALPLYIRDKVAQTTQERAAARANTP